jgi:hypothetical protein
MAASANPTVMSVEEYLWTLYPFGAGDEVVLESIGFKGPLAAFYEDVALPEGHEHV